jgi:hypothetical protein
LKLPTIVPESPHEISQSMPIEAKPNVLKGTFFKLENVSPLNLRRALGQYRKEKFK